MAHYRTSFRIFKRRQTVRDCNSIFVMDSPHVCCSFSTRSPMVHLWPALFPLRVHCVYIHPSFTVGFLFQRSTVTSLTVADPRLTMRPMLVHAQCCKGQHPMCVFTLRIQLACRELSLISELSTGRMDPRVGSGRVTILPDFSGSSQNLGFLSFLLIIGWHLNRYESSNTAFG